MISERETCVDEYEKKMIDFCLSCHREECLNLHCPEANEYQKHLKTLRRKNLHRSRVTREEASGKVRMYEVDGRRHSLEGWALEIGITPLKLRRRLEIMSMEEAIRFAGKRLVRRDAEGRLLNNAGEAHTANEWAKIAGISKEALDARLCYGMTLEEAIATPMGKRKRPYVRKQEAER